MSNNINNIGIQSEKRDNSLSDSEATLIYSNFTLFQVMMKHGYIGEFEEIDDHRGGKIVVNLTGRLNKVGIISPRFDVGISDIEKWTNNLLPSRQFG